MTEGQSIRIPEKTPSAERFLASPKLKMHIAHGVFEGNPPNKNLPQEVSEKSFQALHNQHHKLRDEDNQKAREQIVQIMNKEGFEQTRKGLLKLKLDSNEPPEVSDDEVMYYLHMRKWAEIETTRIMQLSADLAQLNDTKAQQAANSAFSKLKMTGSSPQAIELSLFNSVNGEPGDFYKEFCTGNATQKLAATLTVEEMQAIQPFLEDLLGDSHLARVTGKPSHVAFNSLVALRESMDAVANQTLGQGQLSDTLSPTNKEVLDFYKAGSNLPDVKVEEKKDQITPASQPTIEPSEQEKASATPLKTLTTKIHADQPISEEEVVSGFAEFKTGAIAAITANDSEALRKIGLASLSAQEFQQLAQLEPTQQDAQLQKLFARILTMQKPKIELQKLKWPQLDIDHFYIQLLQRNQDNTGRLPFPSDASTGVMSHILSEFIIDIVGEGDVARLKADKGLSPIIKSLGQQLGELYLSQILDTTQLATVFSAGIDRNNVVRQIQSSLDSLSQLIKPFPLQNVQDFLNVYGQSKIASDPFPGANTSYTYIPEYNLSSQQHKFEAKILGYLEHSDKRKKLQDEYGTALEQNMITEEQINNLYQQILTKDSSADAGILYSALAQQIHQDNESLEHGPYDVAGVSLQGTQHEQDEDAILLDQQHGNIAIFDGLGGHSSGDIASRIAHGEVQRELSTLPANATGQQIRTALKKAWENTRLAIQKHVSEYPEDANTSTTGTVVQLFEDNGKQKAVIMHAGDSRAYAVYKDGTVAPLTQDDSPIREGLTAEDALLFDTVTDQSQLPDRLKPFWQIRNKVTRTFADTGEPTLFTVDITEKGIAYIFVCSDGVHDNLSNEQVTRMANAASDTTTLVSNLALAARSVFPTSVYHNGKEIKMGINYSGREKDDDVSVAAIRTS